MKWITDKSQRTFIFQLITEVLNIHPSSSWNKKVDVDNHAEVDHIVNTGYLPRIRHWPKGGSSEGLARVYRGSTEGILDSSTKWVENLLLLWVASPISDRY